MAADIIDLDEQMLGRLAELDLAAAERVHARLMAAEDAAEVAELARSYQRLARSLRQTLALKARLKRERAQAGEKRDPQDDPRTGPRTAEVREALTRVVWNEYEREEAEDILQESEWFLQVAAREDRFLTDPLSVVVARLCHQLEIRPPEPEPVARDMPAGGRRRSSA
jgi:hypothetical protein